MQYFITIILLLTSVFASAKQKTITLPPDVMTDTSTFLQQHRKKVEDMRLRDMTTSYDSVSFRLWMGQDKVIDIFTTWNHKYSGSITFLPYIKPTGIQHGKIAGQKELLGSREILDDATADSIFHLFMNTFVMNLPSQENIHGWTMNRTGVAYILEYATPIHYSYRHYYAPELFKEIKEAEMLNRMVIKTQKFLDGRRKVFVSGVE